MAMKRPRAEAAGSTLSAGSTSPPGSASSAVDRIDDLPDDLLVHIISFLKMEEAVPLSLLSRRWRNLWTRTPCLDFLSKHYFTPGSRGGTSSQFVERSLVVHDCLTIRSFKVCILPVPIEGERSTSSQRLDDWLLFATQRHVQDLHLDCIGDGFPYHLDELVMGYRLPKFLFECQTLVSMKLHCCRLNLPASFCLGSLKSLHLDLMNPSQEELSALLSGCPVLEKLALEACNLDGSLSVQVVHPRLRILELRELRRGNLILMNALVTVFAPTLKSLTVDLGTSVRRFQAIDLSSLETVLFDQSPAWEILLASSSTAWFFSRRYARLLQQVRHARNISLCRESMQILSLLEVRKCQFRFSSTATNLTLSMRFRKWEIPGANYILRCYNNMENLTIYAEYGKQEYGFRDQLLSQYDFDESRYLESSKHPEVLLQNLKTITVQHLGACQECDSFVEDLIANQDREIVFLGFLLKKATSLQSLTLAFTRSYSLSAKFQAIRPQFTSKIENLVAASEFRMYTKMS